MAHQACNCNIYKVLTSKLVFVWWLSSICAFLNRGLNTGLRGCFGRMRPFAAIISQVDLTFEKTFRTKKTGCHTVPLLIGTEFVSFVKVSKFFPSVQVMHTRSFKNQLPHLFYCSWYRVPTISYIQEAFCFNSKQLHPTNFKIWEEQYQGNCCIT